jgi:hypothetical protein
MTYNTYSYCKAVFLNSLKNGQIPKACFYKRLHGSDYCGYHKRLDPTYKLPILPNEDEDKSMNCAICMETINKGSIFTSTPCKHYYHTRCINKWKKRSSSCPCCRRSLNKRNGGS